MDEQKFPLLPPLTTRKPSEAVKTYMPKPKQTHAPIEVRAIALDPKGKDIGPYREVLKGGVVVGHATYHSGGWLITQLDGMPLGTVVNFTDLAALV